MNDYRSCGFNDYHRHERRESRPRDDAQHRFPDSFVRDRDHRGNGEPHDQSEAAQDGHIRSREQSLGGSFYSRDRLQAPDLTSLKKIFLEMNMLLANSAVERFDQRNSEKLYEKTQADLRKSVERHLEFPSVVQLQKRLDEDECKRLTAIKKRREQADALVADKAETFCKELIEKLPLVEMQGQDTTRKAVEAIRKELEAIRRELNTTHSRFTHKLEEQRKLYENKLAQQKTDMKQYLDEEMEKLRRETAAKETRDIQNQQQSAHNQLIQRVTELEKEKGQPVEYQALLQRVMAQEKKINEMAHDQQWMAKQEQKTTDLETIQQKHTESMVTQLNTVRGDIEELRQSFRETSSSAKLAAGRNDFGGLHRNDSTVRKEPAACADLAELDELRLKVGAVEAKVSGLDLRTLDLMADWYTMLWPEKQAELELLKVTVRNMGIVKTQGPSTVGAEISAQAAAVLRAEMIDSSKKLSDGFKATVDTCKQLVKGVSERVDESYRLIEESTTALTVSRAEMENWMTRVENQEALHRELVGRVQKSEKELRGLIDVCQLSVTSLDNQFSNLSTKELATLILSHLEQLHPNSTRLDADNKWLRDKIDSLENDFQGVKRKLEDGSWALNTNVDANSISLSRASADDAVIRITKRRRMSMTNGGDG